MLRKLVASTALAALTAAPVITYAPSAAACGRAMDLELRDATRLFASAESMLDGAQGADSMNLHMVAGTVDEAFELGDLSPKDKWWGRRLLAQAAIRSRGEVDPTPRPYADRRATRTAAGKKRNLERATASLGRMLNSDLYRDDIGLKTHHAEGLALTGKGEEALETLTDLADRDLLFAPESLRILADLEAELGDQARSAQYRESCQRMVDDKALCGDGPRIAANERATL